MGEEFERYPTEDARKARLTLVEARGLASSSSCSSSMSEPPALPPSSSRSPSPSAKSPSSSSSSPGSSCSSCSSSAAFQPSSSSSPPTRSGGRSTSSSASRSIMSASGGTEEGRRVCAEGGAAESGKAGWRERREVERDGEGGAETGNWREGISRHIWLEAGQLSTRLRHAPFRHGPSGAHDPENSDEK